MSNTTIKIFWSWQSDSPVNCNRNFIESCLEKASKKIKNETTQIIEVDRDTKGIGGSPEITRTILDKIVLSDVFVWDATLCYKKPRPAPNPNVLLELGYAMSILGNGRIIGVMNIANGLNGKYLPFDLNNKRWPITYSLKKHNNFFEKLLKKDDNRKQISEELVSKLVSSIKAALNEPKISAFSNDIDFHTANTFWKIINSKFITNWYNWRINHPQFESGDRLDVFDNYLSVANLPENTFQNLLINEKHDYFIEAVKKYNVVVLLEMELQGEKSYIMSIKAAKRYIEDYDSKYENQCKKIINSIDQVMKTWKDYVQLIYKSYPEIVLQEEIIAKEN